jgi:SSS family transporter
MFTALDWSILGGYIAFAFIVGLLVRKLASHNLDSYFLAGRSLPWWWLGTSMVATTFAADTPLAIAGLVAEDGLAGNWLWWGSILTYTTMTVFFARKWSASRVLTDVELISIRYDGTSARILRLFKACYLSIIINGIVMGWVFKAMNKITTPFIQWDQLLGQSTFAAISSSWPAFLQLGDVNNSLTILVIFSFVVVYSSIGGIRGVVVTDLLQFAMAIGASVTFTVLAVQYVGGLDGLVQKLEGIYPERSGQLLQFFPSTTGEVFPFDIFLIYIGVLWWGQYFSDGSGYLAQRINTARSQQDAEKGSFWFMFAHFGLRTWPWLMVGLVCLVVFPLDNATANFEAGARVAEDREMAYPVLMKQILPPGLLGLTFTSLVAAFMSTVDTHINWGASYLVNDVYKGEINPNASQKQLVRLSRVVVVGMAVLSVAIATQIDSIGNAWKFFFALGAGMGMPQILRWVWWRANAWTEIAGISTSMVMATGFLLFFPEQQQEYLLLFSALGSVVVALTVTFLTKPVDQAVLQGFADRVQPFGHWPQHVVTITNQRSTFYHTMQKWTVTVVGTFALMFGTGYLLLTDYAIGIGLFGLFGFCLAALRYLLRKET